MQPTLFFLPIENKKAKRHACIEANISLPRIQVLWPVMGKSNFNLMREFLLKLLAVSRSNK